MRITYLLIVFGDTGGSMVLYRFMDKLAERGHQVFAVTPSERVLWKPNYSKILLERFKKNGKPPSLRQRVGKIVNPIRKKARDFSNRFKSEMRMTSEYMNWVVEGLLNQWVPSDATISTFCSTAFAGYALMDQTVPFYHMQHYEEVFMDTEASVKMARLTYFLPLILMANCSWLSEQVKVRTGRSSSLLLPGIDTEIFYPREAVSQKYRDPSKISIVSYYSPIKFKAWDEAVKAMEIVFKKTPKRNVEWVVFGGEPPVKPDFPITFVGKLYKDALASLYSKAHLCFMNSWYESFPLPPLEAMAGGTAVAATKPGTEDYLFDGKNGSVVPPRRPELLAEALLNLIENPKLMRHYAEAGVETAKRFTWDHAADELERILNQSTKRQIS